MKVVFIFGCSLPFAQSLASHVLCSICIVHFHLKSYSAWSVVFKQLTNLFPCQTCHFIINTSSPLFSGVLEMPEKQGTIQWVCQAPHLQGSGIGNEACGLVRRATPAWLLCRANPEKRAVNISFQKEHLDCLILNMWMCYCWKSKRLKLGRKSYFSGHCVVLQDRCVFGKRPEQF